MNRYPWGLSKRQFLAYGVALAALYGFTVGLIVGLAYLYLGELP